MIKSGKMLQQAYFLVSMNKPHKRDQQSVVRFFKLPWKDSAGELRKNLCEPDARFIYEKEDLVSLRGGRENAWLDSGVEGMLKYLHSAPIEWFFCSKVYMRFSWPYSAASGDRNLSKFQI